MRKITVLIIALVLLVAPTAIVTAGQNWEEISRTLNEIQVTLGNISSLIEQGALESSEKLSMADLIRRSEIPSDLLKVVETLSEIKSAQYVGRLSMDSKVTTSRTSAQSRITVSTDGVADIPNRLLSLNVDMSDSSDRDFYKIALANSDMDTHDSLDPDMAFSTLFINDNFYFKLNRGSTVFGLIDLSRYRDLWIVARGESSGGAVLNDNADEIERFWGNENKRNAETRSFLEAYVKYPIFSFTKQSDTQIDGGWYTTYRVDLITKNLLDFEEARMRASGQGFSSISAEERAEVMKLLDLVRVSLTVSFNNTYELKRVATDYSFDVDIAEFGGMQELDPYGYLNPEIKRINASGSASLKLSNHNQRAYLEEPRGAIPFEEVFYGLSPYDY